MNPSSSPRQIWQIFRKDFKLLWPLAVSVLVCAVALIVLAGRQDSGGPNTQIVIGLLTPAFVIGGALLIVLAVQLEPLAGVGQDWLARPIRRSNLLCAKLLFVLLMIHVPLVLAGLAQGVWEGFPPGPSLVSAAARNLAALLLLSLPILALGALTRNLTQAIVGSLVLAIVCIVTLVVVGSVLFRIMNVPRIGPTTPGSGVTWVWETLSLAVLQATVAAVLALLYAKRAVLTARVVFCGGLSVCALVLVLPFGPAFAFQMWLSPQPTGQSEVSVAFDPALAREQSQQRAAGVANALTDDAATVVFPLRYAGVPPGTVVNVEHSQIRIVDESGKTLLRRAGYPFPPMDLLGPHFPSIAASGALLRQEYLLMPAELYRQFSDRPVRLEIEQFMTLLRLRTVATLSAAGGDERVAGVGRCTTRLDRSGTGIEARCSAAGELPPCMSMMLALPGGAQNPQSLQCNLDYAPWRTNPWLGALSQVAARLPFTDPTGHVRYAVDASQLHDARVVFTVYEPSAHFVRHVEVPQTRLRDLAISAPQPGPPPQRQGR
jgi:hypothetical protein